MGTRRAERTHMKRHVNPKDDMRPRTDYTAEQLNKLLELLNRNYNLRGGDLDTHRVLGGIRFTKDAGGDTHNKWATDSGPVAAAAMTPSGSPI